MLRGLANLTQGYHPVGFPVLFDGGFSEFVYVYVCMQYGKTTGMCVYMQYGNGVYCKMMIN